VTLPTGTYKFRIANPDTDADVVQVYSTDGIHQLDQFFSLAAERLGTP
jgi:hypothetical protein